MVKRSGH